MLGPGDVAVEIVVPLLVIARFRSARWVLLASEVGIGIVSGECSFASTATAAVLLLWPRVSAAGWISAFVLWVGATTVLWMP